MTVYAWYVRGQKHLALAETSFAAVQKCDLGAPTIMVTDDPAIDKQSWMKEFIRIKAGLPLMVANIEAQLAALWECGEEPIVFLDTDVLLLKPFPVSFLPDTLTVTWRDRTGGAIEDPKDGKNISDVMPYNYGVMSATPGLRTFDAFFWMRERVKAMAPAMQLWWGNQIALTSLCGPRPETENVTVQARDIPWRITDIGPQITVIKQPCEIWNYTPASADEDISSKGALHFKGHSRKLMKEYALKLGLPWSEKKEAA